MVLAVVPLSVLPVFASDAQNIEAAADTVDWNDMSAIEKTEAYKSLYAPGATGIFLAYNAANDGTVTLQNGSGTWINLVDDSVANLYGLSGSFEAMDGETYDKGWQLGDKSVGYKTTWQNVHTNNMEFSSDLLGGGDTTLEMVARMDGMHVEAGGAIADYWDVDGSEDFNVGDKPQWWGSLVNGKNIYMYFKHTTTYNGTDLPNTMPMGAIYSSYSANGNLVGNWNLANNENIANMSGVTANYVVTEKQLGEGKVNVNWQIFSNPATLNHQMLAGGKETDAFKTYGATTQLFNSVPTNVYAVRTYQKVLTEAERMQNHFVDLVFYTGYELDVDAFAAMTESAKLAAYTAVKDVTMDKATANDIARAVEAAAAMNEKTNVLETLGISAKLDGDSNGLRSMYAINLAKIAALEAEGYTVEIGAILGVAKYGEIVKYSYSDLTLGAIDAEVANMVETLVYASANDLGASFTFVDYTAGEEAIFAYTIDFADGGENEKSAAQYTAKFVFRAYVKLTKGDEVTVTYYNGSNTFADGVSLYDVAKLLVADEAFARNEMLNKVITKVETAE